MASAFFLTAAASSLSSLDKLLSLEITESAELLDDDDEEDGALATGVDAPPRPGLAALDSALLSEELEELELDDEEELELELDGDLALELELELELDDEDDELLAFLVGFFDSCAFFAPTLFGVAWMFVP